MVGKRNQEISWTDTIPSNACGQCVCQIVPINFKERKDNKKIKNVVSHWLVCQSEFLVLGND